MIPIDLILQLLSLVTGLAKGEISQSDAATQLAEIAAAQKAADVVVDAAENAKVDG